MAQQYAQTDSQFLEQCDDGQQDSGVRRSQREPKPTEVSLQYRAEQARKAEGIFQKTYESFKSQLLATRNRIKGECTEEELYLRQQDVDKEYEKVKSAYNDLRLHMSMIENFVTYQRKIDSASACTQDMITHLHYRISEVGVKDFDPEDEHMQLRALKKPYAASVYSSVTKGSCQTESRSVKDLAIETAAEVAANKARVKALEIQEKERSYLASLELEKRKSDESIEAQRRKLEFLRAQQELEESDARLQILSAAIVDDRIPVVNGPTILQVPSHHDGAVHPHGSMLNASAPIFSPHALPSAGNSAAEASLARALADAIDRNRLPVPTPKVFRGDPLEFVSFKRSFKTLIESKNVSAEEKIYYLQQYVAGDAREAIAGHFYGSNETDYLAAWTTLERRFGHSFKIQASLRERLGKWPKISSKDGDAFQKYADFLHTCLDAMPYVKDLSILNDCKENQKMAAKLPEWAIIRWSRIVSDSVDSGEYPTFEQFVAFIDKEARVMCNPVFSVCAVKGTGTLPDSKPHNELQGRPVRSLATDQINTLDNHHTETGEKSREGKKYCPFCKEEHHLFDCVKFAEQSIENRNALVRENRRCFSCLRIGHFAKQCRAKHTCQKCKGRHPTVLHDDKQSPKPVPSDSGHGVNSERAASLNADLRCSSTTNVIPVWVSTASNPEKEILVYALLDTQSDSTFIDETVCEKLSAPCQQVNLKLSTLLGRDVTVACQRASSLRVRGYTSARYVDLPPAYTRDFIPLDREHIPTCETARRWNHLHDIAREMPTLLDCDIGILIGYNCPIALAPRQTIIGEEGQPYAVRSELGWSIVGGLDVADSSNFSGYCHRVSLKEVPPLTPHDLLSVLESDFKDTAAGDVNISQDDLQFLQILDHSIMMNAKGHLEMPLPFKSRPSIMLDNRKLATKRLLQLKRRFDRNSMYAEQYIQCVEQMLTEGHAEPAHQTAKQGEVYYIPHHGVYHAKKPDKLRVVFDCSSGYQGGSLNDYLLPGPDLTNDMFGVVCRFRRHPVAVMCDIEKMFHQFHVTPEDRDYLRFLWWEKGDTSKEPVEFRMNVHLFGAKSSPSCANYGLKYLSRLFEDDYPSAGPFLRDDFYVDDGMTSLPTVESAVKLIEESRNLCSRANLRLHKFISNARTVLESVPLTERASELQKVDLNKDDLPTERALGLQWNVQLDLFTFQIQERERCDTRRGILSIVAGLYDPMGFISPFVLEGKAILQEMCKRGVCWDETISDDLLPRWVKWLSDIPRLEEIQIQRCYKPADFGPIARTELHHFSDASTTGYGMCTYLRLFSADRVHCCLITSKARVSPVKVVTIPRLELTAAVIAVKMSQKVKGELKMKIDGEYFWCDSQIVLSYINNDARRFHVFVANRVQFIREHSVVSQWHYVSTLHNPADHASRGSNVVDLLASNWFTGPDFLWSCNMIVDLPVEPELLLGDPEVKSQVLHIQSEDSDGLLRSLEKYSDWEFVIRILARIVRLARRKSMVSPLTVEEIDHASLRVIMLVQEVAFKAEMLAVRQNRDLPSTSKLCSLNPRIVDGALRVGGRLKNASLPLGLKQPLLLPRNEHITRLIVAYCHEQIHHQGKGQTLNQIRSQGYWIVGGSKMVADLIRRCVHCRKLRRPAEEQKMADLPGSRTEPLPPFSFCGMDCFGPFVTKQGRKEYKRYGLLFTCMCSRAVHIEMLDDMTTDSFIIGLRNFIAIRGAVTELRSDHGGNFVGASNEFTAALSQLDISRIATFLAKQQCNFVFNAPLSSHAGGVWERQIRSVRNVLNSTVALSSSRLDDTSLRCLFYEAMSIVNSRPLSTVGDDPSEEPLTPNHLITMKSALPLPPPGIFMKEDVYARKRWRRIQYLTEQFWSRWKKEYLFNLSQRQKWNKSRRNLRVGDIVMLMDAEVPRMQWSLAAVTEALRDKDGLVRRVKLRVGNRCLDKNGKPEKQTSFLERPVQKVVLLSEAE